MRDVSADLSAWLQGVPDGATVRGGARYRVDYGVPLRDKRDLTFLPGTEIFTDYDAAYAQDAARKGFALLSFRGGGGIDVGWTVTGPVPEPALGTYQAWKEHQHGMQFIAVDGVRVTGAIRHVYGDFLYFGCLRGKGQSTPCRNVEVADLTCWGAGRQGIGLIGMDGGVILDSTFGMVGRSLWDIESPGPYDLVQNVDFARNRIAGNVRNNVLTIGGKGQVCGIAVSDNDFGPKPFRMTVKGAGRRGLRITGNVAYVERPSNQPPIKVAGFEDVEIVGNTIPMQARRRKPAIELTGITDYRVEGNICPGASVEMVRVER